MIQVTVIPGDGVGPEIIDAVIQIFKASSVPVEWDFQEAGERSFKRGCLSGVPKETIDSITQSKILLKGPLQTPVGYGEKSANVTLRKLFETYANIRPVRPLPHPGLAGAP